MGICCDIESYRVGNPGIADLLCIMDHCEWILLIICSRECLITGGDERLEENNLILPSKIFSAIAEWFYLCLPFPPSVYRRRGTHSSTSLFWKVQKFLTVPCRYPMSWFPVRHKHMHNSKFRNKNRGKFDCSGLHLDLSGLATKKSPQKLFPAALYIKRCILTP